ncbi:hypothetical protein VTK73DRAFT_10219 [Phialemonium thermophilum]|uniref:Ysc84 actin-binding domain-containing protein n=1 Tax=Phialemonium thermophilum TaxID=223376 RepID=A0ABR3VY72_9PEZI
MEYLAWGQLKQATSGDRVAISVPKSRHPSPHVTSPALPEPFFYLLAFSFCSPQVGGPSCGWLDVFLHLLLFVACDWPPLSFVSEHLPRRLRETEEERRLPGSSLFASAHTPAYPPGSGSSNRRKELASFACPLRAAMQRVSSLLPSWDKSKSNGSGGGGDAPHKHRPSLAALDKVFSWGDRRSSEQPSSHRNSASSAPGAPPKLPPRFGREAYWPTTLDKECEKAARILKSFCTDGFLALEEGGDSQPASPTVPFSPKYVTKKIPPRIIQNAVGLAIFSCMRSGLWMSGSGGSGILVARKADGTWSPPSGILLHTAALGFVIGVDIYDCVLVINSVDALETFTHPKVTLAADVDLTVGPLVTPGLLENDAARWKELHGTVLTYLKAKGKHQSVQLDGSLVTQRGNENERFYGGAVNVLDILAGNIHKSVPETRPLFEQPAPGDAVIETPQLPTLSQPRSPFGIPNADDPDPFGVIALEMAGLEIREAGTHSRPQSSQFEFAPSPTSPVYSKFGRQSVDTHASKSNRGSFMSNKTTVTDACTQTDEIETPETLLSHANSDDGREHGASEKLPTVIEPVEPSSPVADPLPRGLEVAHATSREEPSRETTSVPVAVPEDERDADADDEDEDEDEDDIDDVEAGDDEGEEPVVFEVATAAQPARQPQRTAILTTQVTQVIHAKGALFGDVSSLKSPLRNSFQSSDLQSDRAPTPAIEEVVAPPPPTTTMEEQLVVSPPSPTSVGSTEKHRPESTRSQTQQPPPEPKAVESSTSTNGETRWSAGSRRSTSSSLSLVPQAGEPGETVSSTDESGREPTTPRAEDGIISSSNQSSNGDKLQPRPQSESPLDRDHDANDAVDAVDAANVDVAERRDTESNPIAVV